ncbi:MAG: hypothetical protein SFX72_17675 [Isosphaeraceae bacterium]|nr:hypothetical protein [Isosphaeraceae bacterium]
MDSPLIPQSFWFRPTLACPHLDAIPRTRGRLLDLPDACLLPEFRPLEGEASWARARSAWNSRGLGLSFELTGKQGPISSDTTGAHTADHVQFWIDTRDAREIHRATRFCSRFLASIRREKKGWGIELVRRPIARAIADAPETSLDDVKRQVDLIAGGWRIELFLPAESIPGFDPETNRRLGFMYEVTDPDRGEQFLNLGREFPIGEDPSLWSILELRD